MAGGSFPERQIAPLARDACGRLQVPEGAAGDEVPMRPALPFPASAGIFVGYLPPVPDGLREEDERHRGSKIPLHPAGAGQPDGGLGFEHFRSTTLFVGGKGVAFGRSAFGTTSQKSRHPAIGGFGPTSTPTDFRRLRAVLSQMAGLLRSAIPRPDLMSRAGLDVRNGANRTRLLSGDTVSAPQSVFFKRSRRARFCAAPVGSLLKHRRDVRRPGGIGEHRVLELVGRQPVPHGQGEDIDDLVGVRS